MFVVTEDWYFVSHRLPLAIAAKARGFDVAIATRIGQHGKLLEDAGLAVFPVDFDRSGVGPQTEFRTVRDLVRLYRRERPDIVHHVALKPVIYGSIAAQMTRVGGIVNALGGLGYVFSSRKANARLLKAMVKPVLKRALGGRSARLIVQNSDDLQRVVAGKLAPAASVRLIRGAGVDVARYNLTDADAKPPLVILPARMLLEKGVGEFVAAAKQLRAGGVAARFALVGQPDPANPASATQKEIEAWVSDGLVEYWGWREDMPKIYGEAQIVCLPTYYGEGLPKTLLEGAASGCALVATDIPGCREIVRHGETGWLVPPRDVAALAAALRDAIGNVEARKRYGLAARKSVETEFSLQHVIAATFAVYDELLAEHTAATS